MVLLFLSSGMEIARDTVNLRCMSSLTRDIPKKLKREAEEAACSSEYVLMTEVLT